MVNRNLKAIIGLMLAIHMLGGLIHQWTFMDDVYPFSNWYLFTHVQRHAVVLDLKQEDYVSSNLSSQNFSLFTNSLNRLRKIQKNGDQANLAKHKSQMAHQFSLRGRYEFVERRIEILDYYKNKQWIDETVIDTYNF